MTTDDVLQGLYDQTLVGNKPEVVPLTEQGIAAGIDPNVMLSAITQGAAGSWQLSNLGPRVVARDFAPGFKVALQQKDLRLALEAADGLRLALPGTSLVHQLFAAVEAAHGGDIGTQALVRALEALAGIEVGASSALQSNA